MSATFYCLFTGKPQPEGTWRHNNRIMIPSARNPTFVIKPVDFGSVLKFTQVRKKDEGTYICEANNHVGASSQATFNLTVYDHYNIPHGFPQIHPQPAKTIIDMYKSFVLNCGAYPQSNITWLKDNVPIEMWRFSHSIVPRGDLQMLNTNQHYEGRYECVAENEVGTNYSLPADVFVRARYSAPEWIMLPINEEVAFGSSIKLSCSAQGTPAPEVKWRREDGVDSDPNIFSQSGGVMMLHKVVESANYTCVANSTHGTINHTAEVRVKALPKPPVGVKITEVSPNSVRLSWLSGNVEPVESYAVEYYPKFHYALSRTEDRDIYRTDHEVSNLLPYTEYIFRVIALNANGRSPPSQPVDVTTGELVPGSQPLEVRARAISPNSVVVTWREPNITNGVIKGYKVYYTLSPNSLPVSLWTQHTVENTLMATLKNLMRNRTYTITVLAFTRVGDGPLSENVHVVTNTDVPDMPSNFGATQKSPTSILLHWDRPTTGSITSYRINYMDYRSKSNFSRDVPDSEFSSPSQNIKYELSNLNSDTYYNIWLSAVSEKGEGPPSTTIQIQTDPQGLQICSSAFITKIVSLFCFKNEKKTSSSSSSSQPTSSSSSPSFSTSLSSSSFEHDSTISNIHTTHAIAHKQCTQKNKNFLSHDSFMQKTDTTTTKIIFDMIVLPTNFPGEPKKLKLEAINSTAVRVEWKPPTDRNADIKGYYIKYAEVIDLNEDNWIRSEPVPSNQNEHLISGLSPATSYNITVAAFTRNGEGPNAKPKKTKTKTAVPSVPQRVKLTLLSEDQPGSPGVIVEWLPPKDIHGELKEYLVAFGVQGEAKVDERRFGANIEKFTATFLDHGAIYEFKIAAKNEVDFGEYATETIKTIEGVPSGSPENLTASVLSPSSIQLAWDPPMKKHRQGDILIYEVVYCESMDQQDDVRINTTDRRMLIENLKADTSYTFLIRAFTSVGGGPWASQLAVKTFSLSVLPPPTNVQSKFITLTSMEVTWEPPVRSKSMKNKMQVVGYRVYYSSQPNSNVENWPSLDVNHVTWAEIRNLEPNTAYAVKVRAKTTDGRFGGYSHTSISDRFINEKPDAVSGFIASVHNSRSVTLEWKPPRKPGVSRYKIEYMGIRKIKDFSGMEETTVDVRREIIVPKEEKLRHIDNLVSSTLYTFNITAKFVDGSWGPTNILHIETTQDVSSLESPTVIRSLSDSMVKLGLKPANEERNSVLYYWLVVLPTDAADTKRSFDFNNREISLGSPRSGWIAGKFDGDHLPTEFIIGDGRKNDDGDVFNRPLPKNYNYVAFLRAFYASNKHISSPYSRPLLPNPYYQSVSGPHHNSRQSIDLLWIVAPICAAVVLILLVILIIIIASRKRRINDKSVSTCASKVVMTTGSAPVPASVVDPVEIRRVQYQSPAMLCHPPIAISDLECHIEQLRANDNAKFSLEYESIDPGQQFTWEASNLEVNKSKNRYANVIAYDHSRVVLQSMPHTHSLVTTIPGQLVAGSDYINANYLDGFRKPNAYIATQGPMPDTFCDFWRMVWEKQSGSIVMMTKLEERNRIKCDQYWPSRGSEMYGSLQVTLVDVIELATFTIRTFQLSMEFTPEKREVKHFQFTAWPDYGVPSHPAPLLLFMKRVKFMTLNGSGPVIVHCSAGVGRTGVYIVLDAMLERIKHSGTVDIYGHVTCLRSQRNYMVQTEDQYVFIHTAILEAVTCGNTEVPARNLFAHIQSLMEPANQFSASSSTISGMEAEFKARFKLSSGKNTTLSFASANQSCNKHKNRLVNVLPLESTRVCLQPIRGVDGSDYINANFIDGYRYRKAYIATQGPLAETVEDFWRAMWECNCNIIVMLTKLKEQGREKCHQYWPNERSARYQYFVVDPLAEYNMPQYILREFKVTDARDGQSRTVRQFQLTDWPEYGVPPTGDGFIEFIGQVHKTKEQFGQEGPIAVHCSSGVGRTGVFITLSIVLERMRFEGVVDMFQTVNILRTQRPGLVQTGEQYSFCYRAALEYLGSFDHYTN
ncbi:hypothetical protein HELRODRAFT_102544 [Helobdella robusta]|uniref:protein-tyrosine-phosphatase n=1 Tax=Helobdella robusta TaxID=6412 RepID=T1EDA3_HELRO|nr:hypothetical protein HELRODRAFT_102544 [Helobdella robusta]ESN95495.1 hypothetical protein HELRODRAFT_102544 [Helobdella robusta]